MVFDLRIVWWAALFFGVLEYAFQKELLQSFGGYIMTLVPLLVISSLAGYQLYRRKIRTFVPLMLSVVVPLLLSLVDEPVNATLFMLLSATMYYIGLLSLYRLRLSPTDKTAQALLHATLMASLFFFYSALLGLYINFAVPLWLMMLAVGITTGVVSYVGLMTISREEVNRGVLYSSILGFTSAELFLVATLWPFGYLTSGVLLLVGYFALWDLSVDAFSRTLSLRKLFFRFLAFAFLVLVVLLSTPWKVIVG